MLGAYLSKSGVVKPETCMARLKWSFGESKAHLMPLNEKAIAAGAESVR